MKLMAWMALRGHCFGLSGYYETPRMNRGGAGRSHGSHNTLCARHCWPVLCCSEVPVASESHLRYDTTGRADLVQVAGAQVRPSRRRIFKLLMERLLDEEASSGPVLNLIFQQKGTALNFCVVVDSHLPAQLANDAPCWTSKEL